MPIKENLLRVLKDDKFMIDLEQHGMDLLNVFRQLKLNHEELLLPFLLTADAETVKKLKSRNLSLNKLFHEMGWSPKKMLINFMEREEFVVDKHDVNLSKILRVLRIDAKMFMMGNYSKNLRNIIYQQC